MPVQPAGAGWLRIRADAIEVRVRVTARASRDALDGFHGDRLKMWVTAPPTQGEANAAVVRFLARAAHVPPSRGRVVAGARDRSKTVVLGCPDPAAAARSLWSAVAVAIDNSKVDA